MDVITFPCPYLDGGLKKVSHCSLKNFPTILVLILDLRPANESRRYKVTPSLIG